MGLVKLCWNEFNIANYKNGIKSGGWVKLCWKELLIKASYTNVIKSVGWVK